MKAVTTFDESGRAMSVTQCGYTYPARMTFECVNDFVHNTDTTFEDLESLCLGMASLFDKLHEYCNAFDPNNQDVLIQNIRSVLNGGDV